MWKIRFVIPDRVSVLSTDIYVSSDQDILLEKSRYIPGMPFTKGDRKTIAGYCESGFSLLIMQVLMGANDH